MQTLLIIAATLVAAWVAFIVFVWVVRPPDSSLGDAMRLLPDTLRLVRRLASDPAIPRRTRWMVWVLLVYLASPVDLVPDFLPVVGYADDAIITAYVLRRVIARAGETKVAEHWPGSPEGMASLRRVLRLDRNAAA